jgi:hypothetical protein
MLLTVVLPLLLENCVTLPVGMVTLSLPMATPLMVTPVSAKLVTLGLN